MAFTQPSGFNLSFFDMKKAKRNFDPSRKRVVGYARISVDEDGENFVSIENQQSILEEFYYQQYADTTSDYAFIADDNVSGYKFEREGLYQLISLIESGKCNIIIAKDLSRIGRHGALTQLFIEQCERVGVRVHAMGDYDSHKESDDLILGIRAWSNERVVKDTSAKIKKIVKHRQENGTWICAVPFGYRVVNYQKRLIEVDEEAAETVRKVFDMYLTGKGCHTIARELTLQGVPTASMLAHARAIENGDDVKRVGSSGWTANVVQGILCNEFYIGTLITGRYRRDGINGRDVRTDETSWNKFPDHHEAIVSKEVFAAAQEIREAHKKHSYRTKNCREHLYHGLVFCGECGEKQYAYAAKNRPVCYVCSRYFKYGKTQCTRHSVPETVLTSIAINFLRLTRESCRDAIDSLDDEFFPKKSPERKDSTAQLEKELADLDTQLRVVEEQRIKQIIAHPEREESISRIYDEMAASAQKRRDELAERISSIKENAVSVVASVKKAKRAIDIIDQIIESGVISRRAATAIFERIVVHEDGNIDIQLKPYLKMLEPVEFAASGKVAKHAAMNFVVSADGQEKAGINDVCDGDPLEIYTDHDGEVILKKYSPIGEMSSFAKDYTESLFRSLGHIAVIVDRDQVVAASGVPRKELSDKPISPDLETAIASRQTVTLNRQMGGRTMAITNEEEANAAYTAQVISPIIADGEAIGAVLLMSRDSGVRMGDTEIKVAETAAGIVGRQMEQ